MANANKQDKERLARIAKEKAAQKAEAERLAGRKNIKKELS
jgi:hypothetical protein